MDASGLKLRRGHEVTVLDTRTRGLLLLRTQKSIVVLRGWLGFWTDVVVCNARSQNKRDRCRSMPRLARRGANDGPVLEVMHHQTYDLSVAHFSISVTAVHNPQALIPPRRRRFLL